MSLTIYERPLLGFNKLIFFFCVNSLNEIFFRQTIDFFLVLMSLQVLYVLLYRTALPDNQ